jgi:uncharacterized protein YeaO (DUF488 family)
MKRKVSAKNIKLKRAYEPPTSDDGPRILIDRLWPRGLEETCRWDEFCRRNSDLLDRLRSLARQEPITLVYSARDEEHNDAVELRRLISGPDKQSSTLVTARGQKRNLCA